MAIGGKVNFLEPVESRHWRKTPVRLDRKFRRSVIGRLFQLQNNWTGHRVSDTKAAAEIFKCVAERIEGRDHFWPGSR